MHKGLVLGFALFLSLFCLSTPRLNAADHIVDVYPTGYLPNYLEIAPGDNVFWINQDDFSHTVTSEDGAWTRGILFDYQDQFGLNFPYIGIYDYFCEIDGFTGTIVVRNAGPAPPNDQCNSAIAMEDGTVYTANTANATSTGDPNASCATLGKGVWYTFTAAANGTIRISTCGSGFDTVLAVYTGFCGSLSPVAGACNDDNGPSCSGITASVAFSGTAGTTYRILAGGYGGASGNLRIMATNSVVVSTWQERQVSFDIGPSIARPNTNLIHIVDQTNDRLLTLDTTTGAFVSSIRLYGKLAFSGLMCFSLDGQLLYVPLNTSNRFQVISLATLTTADLVPLTVAPSSIAAGSDGALYTPVSGRITKLDPTTGKELGAVLRSYYGALLKGNASGNRLYVMELGLSGGGAMIDEYAVVPSALPSYVSNHYNGKANDKDFVIAEDIGWLYSTSGGVYGIGAWNMNTRTYSFWPYDSPYGAAVAMVPNDSFVYGASADFYGPRIRRFNRLTGAVSATFDINAAGRGTGSVHDRSLQVTPNGRIFYARETRKIGLIGASALTTNTPVTAEIIDGGTNRTVFAGEVFTLSAIAPAASGADTYSWSKIQGPGEVTFSASDSLATTAQVAAPGNYILEIVRSSGTWLSRDRVYVTAIPVRFDQYSMNVDGGFQMRLRSGPGSFEIQASSNLVHWDPLTNFSSPGEITIVDENRNRLPRRFYRAQLITN
jgi:plastocyanin